MRCKAPDREIFVKYFLSQNCVQLILQCIQNLGDDSFGIGVRQGTVIGKLLRGVKLFDIYRGTGVPEGKKSMAFSLELRADDRTLTDTDSEAVVSKVLDALKDKLNAILR